MNPTVELQVIIPILTATIGVIISWMVFSGNKRKEHQENGQEVGRNTERLIQIQMSLDELKNAQKEDKKEFFSVKLELESQKKEIDTMWVRHDELKGEVAAIRSQM